MLALLMVWPWWVTLALAVITAAVLIGVYDEKLGDGGIIAVILLGSVALIFGAFALTVSLGRHYDRINCRRFADTTGRPTRYVIYSIGSDDCLTPSGSRWIPIQQLREFGQ
jgi:hypothetical protein